MNREKAFVDVWDLVIIPQNTDTVTESSKYQHLVVTEHIIFKQNHTG